MILRKRAWDLMRDSFVSVRESTRMAEAILLLRQAIKQQADNDLLVVVDEGGSLQGMVSIRHAFKVLEDCVLTDERVLSAEETNWDKAFGDACGECCMRVVADMMDKKPTIVRPEDPLLVVMDRMVQRDSRWAVVVEAGRPLGVVAIGDVFREIAREMERAGGI